MMNTINCCWISIFLLCISSNCFSQIIFECSFEAKTLNWSSCNNYSTIDIQPGSWYINNPPSDGEKYLSMVTRGQQGSANDNKSEDLQIKLDQTLIVGRTYKCNIDLAYSTTAYNDSQYYNHPIKLIIWGSKYECRDAEKIWESEEVNNTSWKQFEFEINPKYNEYRYINLEAYWISESKYFGNILIDNMIIEDTLIEINASSLKRPNVITPNEDGYNDTFIIDNLPSNSNFKVFNRWGYLVYEDSDYNNSWSGHNKEGEQLEHGNYWYVLNIGDDEIIKGSIFVKTK